MSTHCRKKSVGRFHWYHFEGLRRYHSWSNFVASTFCWEGRISLWHAGGLKSHIGEIPGDFPGNSSRHSCGSRRAEVGCNCSNLWSLGVPWIGISRPGETPREVNARAGRDRKSQTWMLRGKKKGALSSHSGVAVRIATQLIDKKRWRDRTELRATICKRPKPLTRLPTTVPSWPRPIRQVESQAADAYWAAWRTLPITSPRKDEPRSRRRHAQACSEWNGSSQPAWLTSEVFSQQIQPLLAKIPTAAIRSRIGVSRWYAGRIREGYRPHPRFWQTLAELVGASGDWHAVVKSRAVITAHQRI